MLFLYKNSIAKNNSKIILNIKKIFHFVIIQLLLLGNFAIFNIWTYKVFDIFV